MTLAAACAACGISRTQAHRMAKDGRIADLLRGRDASGRLLVETNGNLTAFEALMRGRMRLRIDAAPCRRERERLEKRAAQSDVFPLELNDEQEGEDVTAEQAALAEEFWRRWGAWRPEEELSADDAWGQAVALAVQLVWGEVSPPELSPNNVAELLSALEQTQADVALGARFDLEQYLSADALVLIEEAEDGCVESGLDLQDKLYRNRVPQPLVARAQGALLALERLHEGEG